MARREIIVLQDDLNPEVEKDVRTYRFGFEGISYEIDLGPENGSDLSEALAPFLAVARKEGRTKVASVRQPMSGAEKRRQNEEARTWLRGPGKYPVSERGRIPGHYLEAFLSKTVNPDHVEELTALEAAVAEVPKPRAATKKTAKKAVAKK